MAENLANTGPHGYRENPYGFRGVILLLWKSNQCNGNPFSLNWQYFSFCCQKGEIISQAYLFRTEDLSKSSFQWSLSLFPFQIERKTDTIMASITRNPMTKNPQNRTSIMVPPFRCRGHDCSPVVTPPVHESPGSSIHDSESRKKRASQSPAGGKI